MSEVQPSAQELPQPKERLAGDDGGRDLSRLLPLLGVATLAAVLAVWWSLTSWLEIVPPLYFPTPEEVIQRIGRLSGGLVSDAIATLIRVVISWLVGSALGIIVGLAMVRSRVLYALLSPIIEALRPIPPVALIPFVILWFGIGDDGKIFLGALACFMVMVINTIVSSQNLSPVYMRAARSLGASDRQVYRTVVLPGIVPELVSGLRIGSALAFAVIVAAEFLGAESGIGRLIMLASRTLDTPVVLLGTIVIGLQAFLVERVIKLVAARVTRWAEKSSD
jgi:taurine transport system permease protein